MLSFTLLFTSLFIASLPNTFLASNDVQVDVFITVKNVRNTEGKLLIGLFRDQASFESETADFGFEIKKSSIHDGVVTQTVKLPVGNYGLSLLDDENGNMEMDYNWIGIPKEGFGFSNYYHGGLSRPTIDDFQIEVKKESQNKVEIIIRYI
ncbi:MAG: hypothetical protein ACI8QD_000594 [Cyclobacteriaceae bacterium]|jgi:uncharacterized protein (DUF2141 family)